MLSVTERLVDKDVIKKSDIDNWDDIKKKVKWTLVNSKLVNDNDNIIHKDRLDLSMVPVVAELSNNREYLNIYRLTYDDLKNYNISEDELYSAAQENVSNDTHKRIINATRIGFAQKELMYPLMKFKDIGDMLGSQGMIASVNDSEDGNDTLLVITNKYDADGSMYMFDPSTLQNISERMNDSFYILPNSRHSVLCVSKKYVTKDKTVEEAEDDLLDMVFKLNRKSEEDDILSYRIYYYSKDDGRTLLSIKQEV